MAAPISCNDLNGQVHVKKTGNSWLRSHDPSASSQSCSQTRFKDIFIDVFLQLRIKAGVKKLFEQRQEFNEASTASVIQDVMNFALMGLGIKLDRFVTPASR